MLLFSYVFECSESITEICVLLTIYAVKLVYDSYLMLSGGMQCFYVVCSIAYFLILTRKLLWIDFFGLGRGS